MSKIDAMNSRRGQTLYHILDAQRRVIVDGPCRTWRGNDNFRLPVKNGCNGFDITPSNAHHWSMISPPVTA